MTMDSYELVVRETETHDGIDADIIDGDGLVDTTTQVTYADYDLRADRDGDGPDPISEAFTVDATTLNLHLERGEDTLEFRVVADEAEEVAQATVNTADWNLVHTN